MFFLHLFQSHFSIKKGAAALGIGTESVICIKADERLLLFTFYKWYRIQQQNKHLAVFKNPPTLMNLCHLTWLWLCFYSGKLIPADLERRILEAKQKVLWSYMVSSRAGHVWSGQTEKKKKTSLPSLSFVCFSAGFCAVLCERHRWYHSIRRLRPTHRHLWHLQKVQHLDARGREWHTHTPQQRENKEIKPPAFSSHVDKSVLSVWPRTAPSWPTLKLAVFYLKPEIRKSGAQAVNHGLPHLTSPSWFLSLKELCVNEEAASAVTGRHVY